MGPTRRQMAPRMMQMQYLRSKGGRLGSCQDRIQRSHSQDEGDIAPEAFRTPGQAAPPSQSRGWAAQLEPRLDTWAGETQAHTSPGVVPSPETVMLRDTAGGAGVCRHKGAPQASPLRPPAECHLAVSQGSHSPCAVNRGQTGDLSRPASTKAEQSARCGHNSSPKDTILRSISLNTREDHRPASATTLSAGSAVRTSPSPQLTLWGVVRQQGGTPLSTVEDGQFQGEDKPAATTLNRVTRKATLRRGT